MDLKDLGFTIRELLRYGYAGALAVFLLYWLIPPERSKQVAELGAAALTFMVIFAGVLVYATYKGLFDLFVVRVVECCHGKWMGSRACIFRLLHDDYQVSKSNQLDALRIIRSNLFPDVIRERFHTQNTEVHILFMTAFECFLGGVAGCIAWCRDQPSGREAIVMLVVAIVMLVVGTVSQFSVCRQQCSYFLTLDMQKETADALRKAHLGSG